MLTNISVDLTHYRAEKARLQAEAKAAEDARKRAEAEAAAEAKRKRELEREAARQALLQVNRQCLPCRNMSICLFALGFIGVYTGICADGKDC